MPSTTVCHYERPYRDDNGVSGHGHHRHASDGRRSMAYQLQSELEGRRHTNVGIVEDAEANIVYIFTAGLSEEIAPDRRGFSDLRERGGRHALRRN
ncbi:hypothetical protein EVAR_5592_1 [Eumeta japonica]|uniref:Uncharacterized protein n=1 Tax=Eumeta variegata TaxID=151549 RepID=A0A4C1U1I1_EUMVA|nr:hypothetical protein EVAR_5592_1 [Eumeta japonica]